MGSEKDDWQAKVTRVRTFFLRELLKPVELITSCREAEKKSQDRKKREA